MNTYEPRAVRTDADSAVSTIRPFSRLGVKSNVGGAKAPCNCISVMVDKC